MAPGTRVSVTGVVIAEAGRLGTPALLAIADGSAGIAIRVPRDAGPFNRGTLLEVNGTLAAPYGQLEVRPSTGGIQSVGIGLPPTAIPVGTSGLDESIEGRLATSSGTLAAKPRRSSGGDLTITLERDGAAPVKVIADDSSHVAIASLEVGTVYQVIGVVGQRATHKDASDGYRICLRDPADLIAMGPAVVPSPSASPGTGSGAPGGGPAATVGTVKIAQALGIRDRDVAIEASVTAPATLLDASGRRIVVQDSDGAIELLVPVGVSVPPVGSRIRAEGRVGVAYGAPRFRATALAVLERRLGPTPTVLHGQPGAVHEWRLVSLTGRIEKVHKLGDRWRAELAIGSQRVAIVGQPGSGTTSSAVVEGRTATVVGIVRRPFPTATDRRFAILPRFPADMRVAGGGAVGPHDTVRAGSTRPVTRGIPTTAAGGSIGTVDADMIDLATFLGRVVRVGGLVADLRPDGVMLDDGTTTGRLVLRGAALDLLPLLEPDDAINATGRVEQLEDGAAVVVDDPGAIAQAGDPAVADPGSDSVGSAPDASGAPATASIRADLAAETWLDAGAVGLATMSLMSALSLAFTLLRRRRARQRLAGRIAVRLSALEGPSRVASGPRSAERDRTTLHSA